ncbi:hypothetical protein TURU_001867 [Turdus rufiventris]|nr:hypothetical protein TURU_001867 [Turdus rufiventris]
MDLGSLAFREPTIPSPPPNPAHRCPQGGAETVKKVTLSHPVHPFIRRSVNVVEKYFEEFALRGQDILGSPEKWDKVLALIPEDILPGQGVRRG